MQRRRTTSLRAQRWSRELEESSGSWNASFGRQLDWSTALLVDGSIGRRIVQQPRARSLFRATHMPSTPRAQEAEREGQKRDEAGESDGPRGDDEPVQGHEKNGLREHVCGGHAAEEKQRLVPAKDR